MVRSSPSSRYRDGSYLTASGGRKGVAGSLQTVALAGATAGGRSPYRRTALLQRQSARSCTCTSVHCPGPRGTALHFAAA
jgi:hypothetical protein